MKNSLLILTVLLIALTTLMLWATHDKAEPSAPPLPGEQSEVPIGGAFTLTDQSGNTVQDSDFRGRVMLVFFGFTRCPDICPVTAATLSRLMDLLGDGGSQVAPIFITVDPAHDTPGVLKDYLAHFNSRLIALTGSPQQIADVAAAYKAYYSQSEAPADEELSEELDETEQSEEAEANNTHGAGPGHAHGGSNMVEHSGHIYMMGKNGKYIRHFPYNASEQELAQAVRDYLREE
jgi:protein SCO1